MGCFVMYMFFSNYPSSGDINSSNLSCSLEPLTGSDVLVNVRRCLIG